MAPWEHSISSVISATSWRAVANVVYNFKGAPQHSSALGVNSTRTERAWVVHPTIKFVNRVWRMQRQGSAHAFLAFFDDDHVFTEQHLQYPSEIAKVRLPHGGVDLYFAPHLFRRKRRRNEYAIPGRWLYADLDESDPRRIDQIPPTVAWETSRGRYQALWLLDAEVDPEALADLNQRLTYFTGADKGGWSLTKVLRVPGSISTKRLDDFKVRLMWWKQSRVYPPELVQELTKQVKTPNTHAKELGDIKLPKAPPERILRRYGKRVPGRVRKLLKATEARGDRSERLWQLECDLLSAGMKPEQVLVIVRESVWNKYAGQRRELKQLWTEIGKAASSLDGARSTSAADRKTRTESSSSRSRSSRTQRAGRSTSSARKRKSSSSDTSERQLTAYSSFMSQKIRRPEWMVEGIWSESAHGVLAGEAKTYKSVISNDLAISVASGTAFLNTFQIPSVGPVIIIQEENDPGEFQDRMNRIAHSRGLGASVGLSANGLKIKPSADLPIHVMNNQGFDLTSKKDVEWLARQCKNVKPALVVLDPFYLLTPGIDENSQAQVTPVLKNLLKLKQAYGVGIQIIHHYKKQNPQAPVMGAARMSGTGVFHRWFESAVYVERVKDDQYTVRLLPDHRGHAPQGAIRVTFDLGTEDDLEYNVEIAQGKADKAVLHERMRSLFKEKDEWQLNDLRIAMGLSSTRPVKQIAEDHGLIVETRHTGRRGRPGKFVRRKKRRGRRLDVEL